jgi:hypothetical protein
LAEALFGVQLRASASGALEAALAGGTGGEGEVHLTVDHRGDHAVRVEATPVWPSGWMSGHPVAAPSAPQIISTLRLPVRVPVGVRGTFTIPVRMSVRSGDAEVSWQETLRVGRGDFTEWQVVGPELPGEAVDPEILSRQADNWRWDRPVRFGSADRLWQRVTALPPLRFPDWTLPPTNRSSATIGAVAATALESDVSAWVELTAGLGGSGSRQELQFYLDGRELPDLRLGRETWSPKRLPLFLGKGRHTIVVVARSRDRLPEVSLRVCELEDTGGGRVRPVAP